jgi:hypothetical protein
MISISIQRLLILLAPLAMALAACEQVVDPVGIPYVERIVVRGIVETGRVIDSIQIMRTLPINEVYSIEKAAIKNAVVTVRSGSGAVGEFQYIGAGRYGQRGAGDKLVAVAGETYTLNVEWPDKGKRVTATTVAPAPVSIDSLGLVALPMNEWGGVDTVLEATFAPQGNQVYGITHKTLVERGNPNDPSDRYYYEASLSYSTERIARRRDTSDDGRIRLRTRYPVWYGGDGAGGKGDTLFAVLYTFDPQFYDYYQTFNSSQDFEGGPFSSGGETIAWNVSGDGIGMFIGRARVERRIRP